MTITPEQQAAWIAFQTAVAAARERAPEPPATEMERIVMAQFKAELAARRAAQRA
jgi:hypothetical protein